MSSLRCESLCKAFDGVRALRDVRLGFPSSGIVAIVGPNGAGKTTLINVLTGFLRPQTGRVFLDERQLCSLPPHKIARLGIARTFQDLRLISQVSAIENVLLARPNQKGERLLPALLRNGVATEEARNRDEAVRWLRFVGLADQANELAGELSYGQQKLLTLACCLATDARILLLDEPVAGVHPQMVAQILRLLRELRDLGKLVIFIEHDLASVRQVADLVVVMDEGKIIAQGKPSEVLDRPEIIEAYVT
ncbi:MAG: ABC transporter ATP-binding protein [Verrucomicrobia bacterium]|nr:MAG: ABC transporter ATP-binding protein [Verrucomicrobiota bacterium]